MNPYSDNSYFNYYTPQRSVSVTDKGNNQRDYVPHPSETPFKETKHIFAIDSRQRDFSLFPDPNEYSISVPEHYKNIRSLELKAAIVPKSEYNINSNNNTIPFIMGDFISNVKINSYTSNMFKKTTATVPPPNGTSITFTITGGKPSRPAVLTSRVVNGGIGPITITYGGSGYTPDDKLRIVASIDGYADITDIFTVDIGIYYNAKLREGHYSNTGNPEYYHIAGDGVRTVMRSNVPVNGLSREIENAMGNAIYSRNTNNTSLSYKRTGWYELPYDAVASEYAINGNNESLNDYPAPISVRYVSQYPTIQRFENNSITSEKSPDYYETNSCNFNRMNFTNSLIVIVESLQPETRVGDRNESYVVFGSFTYKVIDYHYIGYNGSYYEYMLMLFPYGIYSAPKTTKGWEVYNISYTWDGVNTVYTRIGNNLFTNFFEPQGIDTEHVTLLGAAPWHILFSYPDADIASLIGFNRKNYINGLDIPAITIETGGQKNYLQGRGFTHRTDNDWTLYPGPEYVILSFRSKFNNTSSTLNAELNDRVDSDQESNIGRSFACLIFDNNQPAVLQGLTTSRGPDYDKSGKQSTEATQRYSQILNLSEYNTSIDTPTTKQNGRILDSYVGSYNSGLYEYQGITKALKGQDFDVKKIEFTTPVSRLTNIAIQFSKFSKVSNQTDNELYNFRGREHLLLFEIVTCENTNVF